MLIPILNDYYDQGYLPRPEAPALSPFFPNCNLAVRRSALDQAGGYDQAMTAGEDADLCRRVAAAGWELFYQPKAIVKHEPRPDVLGVLRQWWNYGYGGSVHFHKARRRRFEVYGTWEARPRIHRHRPLLALDRFPFVGMIFLTYFPMLLLLLLAAGVAAAVGAHLVAGVLALAALVAFGWVVVRRTPGQGLAARLGHALLIVLVNTTCCAGCLASSLRRGKLFLYPGI
jgi:cellulose synthase/poly-beta-1,6-N-acetylglucosamine synthase-like glycosyltransferase